MDYIQFQQLCHQYQIDVSRNQFNQLSAYAHYLVTYNKKVNLTAIVDMDEIFIKHFLDSMLVLKHIDKQAHIADVGSGAGFPGLVLAIFLEESHVTLIEPTTKRVNFLADVVALLKLKNVTIINERAEALKKERESYDVVVSRAVARLDILSELCLPLVKVHGKFIALKGAHGQFELEAAQSALKILHANVEQVDSLKLPD